MVWLISSARVLAVILGSNSVEGLPLGWEDADSRPAHNNVLDWLLLQKSACAMAGLVMLLSVTCKLLEREGVGMRKLPER